MQINRTKPIVENNFKRFVELAYPDATDDQVNHMRVIFYSGAWWLLQFSMMTLDEGDDASDADLELMADIHSELEAYCQSVILRNKPKN